MQLSTLIVLCGVISSISFATPTAVPTGQLSPEHVNSEDCPPDDGSSDDGSSGDGSSDGGSPPSLSFYMCCAYNAAAAAAAHYGPPYACMFGPSSGVCPQGAGSTLTYAWLCTYELGDPAGDIVSLALLTL